MDEQTPLIDHDGFEPIHHRRESIMENIVDAVVETAEEIKDAVVETAEEIKETLETGMEEIKQVLEEPVAVPIAPRDPGDHARKLTAIQLAVLVFYKVSGGPFGCEVAVKSAGPLYTLIGFILFPILWCVPEALITAELGSAFPEPSGRECITIL